MVNPTDTRPIEVVGGFFIGVDLLKWLDTQAESMLFIQICWNFTYWFLLFYTTFFFYKQHWTRNFIFPCRNGRSLGDIQTCNNTILAIIKARHIASFTLSLLSDRCNLHVSYYIHHANHSLVVLDLFPLTNKGRTRTPSQGLPRAAPPTEQPRSAGHFLFLTFYNLSPSFLLAKSQFTGLVQYLVAETYYYTSNINCVRVPLHHPTWNEIFQTIWQLFRF